MREMLIGRKILGKLVLALRRKDTQHRNCPSIWTSSRL